MNGGSSVAQTLLIMSYLVEKSPKLLNWTFEERENPISYLAGQKMQ